MATKKTAAKEPANPQTPEELVEARVKAKREAVTVDGTESYPPPGMDLPDGGTVPLDVDDGNA